MFHVLGYARATSNIKHDKYTIIKQTDQTTTLCVQEVEIYLERWEVLGALVDVSVDR